MIPIGTNLRQNKLPVVTLAIIGANVFFYIIELLVPEPVLGLVFFFFGYGPANWWNPLALLAHMFLHADIYHIAFNMLFFWIFAGPVEERVGRMNFATYYLISGVAAAAANTVMTSLTHPDALTPCIGASGAISGIMGLFLYRCHYSKLKMVISPILLPRQYSIPVVPLVMFWFLKDVIMGFLTIDATGGVAHWAHVGGFIAGIAIGRIKRYGQEGQVENLRDKILQKLESGGGWAAAEKELMKLLNVAPDDPELNLDLARLHADGGNKALAERFYAKAVRLLFAKKPLDGAYALLEYNDALGKPMPLSMQARAADTLTRSGDYENALRLYLLIAGDPAAKGPMHEKSLAYCSALYQHTGMTEQARQTARSLLASYPESSYKPRVGSALRTEPGMVFRKPAKPHEPDVEKEISAELKEAEALGWLEVAQRFFMDPAFWSILLFLNIAAPFLFPGLYFSSAAPVALFVMAYVMTVIHRLGIEEWLLYFGPSQKQAEAEFEVKRLFNLARTAEMGGKFSEAAKLYEDLLLLDKTHTQGRFNLARMYHGKLGDIKSARKHYRALMELLPDGHAFRVEAETALKSSPAQAG